MDIAIIKDKLVIDAAVFDDIDTAQEFLELDVWPGAEAVVELHNGYAIGDGYDITTGEWTHIATYVPEPEEPDEPVEPKPTTEERLTALESDVAAITSAVERGLSL